MKIREATSADLSEILSVLKASLGESSSKKTDVVWRFKHQANPFGESLILVAEEKGMIIGVRAFMRWKWQRGRTVFSAYRAVDTATHPDYQGRGIFKQLTLKALEIGKERGDHFVFNTPNKQSKPGYLKMGWEEIGKVQITLVPGNITSWNRNKGSIGDKENILISSELIFKWNKNLIKENRLFTPKSIDYLNWRYISNPLQEYMLKANDNIFLAGYIKKHNKLKELRISEIIFTSEMDKGKVKNVIRSWARKSGAHFISYSSPFNISLFKSGLKGNYGPVLTFKSINLIQMNHNIESWGYSIGDLELF